MFTLSLMVLWGVGEQWVKIKWLWRSVTVVMVGITEVVRASRLGFLFFGYATWHVKYVTRDQTCTLCSGSTESKPLERQGRPGLVFLNVQEIGTG